MSAQIKAVRKNSCARLFNLLLTITLAAVTSLVVPLAHANVAPESVAIAGSSTPPVTPGLDQAATLRSSQAAIGRKISDFTLLDRESRPIRLASYLGKPLLVSFIYTGCFQACPLTTRALQNAVEAGRDLFGTNQYNVVSIGFNQPVDTPQALKAFALQHRINQPNWDFLSPHVSVIEPLAREFGFSYVATPAGFIMCCR